MDDTLFHNTPRVVIYAATRITFKPNLEKMKKIGPNRGNGIFLPQKNLIKLFYTLDKTPLGVT